ncbi:MAG: hypothetical protein QMD02_08665 [Bacteroidales bacterium]|nr:hypothetical protein [Bacteroidales bacterium]
MSIISTFIVLLEIIMVSRGATLDLYMLLNILVGIAPIFWLISLIYKNYYSISYLIFLILLGLGIFLMTWSGDKIGLPNIFANIISSVWVIIWTSACVIFIYSQIKSKSEQ